MQKFITGRTYKMKSVCDQDCIWYVEIIGRTAKTVTAKIQNEIRKFRIKTNEEEEFFFPLGRYSMSPCLRASKLTNIIQFRSLK